MSRAICLYFQVHQPERVARFRVFDIGSGRPYFDERLNRDVFQKVAAKCYLPANALLSSLLGEAGGTFRVALSLSGIFLEAARHFDPRVLDSFRNLARHQGVEVLGETYYHSLSALGSRPEFAAQVDLHRRLVADVFGRVPSTFRNTELIFRDDLAPLLVGMGFRAALAEGAPAVLGERSPNAPYRSAADRGLTLLLRNFRLSDDIGFRFSDPSWVGHPLSAATFCEWVACSPGDVVNLFMDYETFGEHHWEDSGIFAFLGSLPAEARARGLEFLTPAEAAALPAAGSVSFPEWTSWADQERDVSAWLGNALQGAAFRELYALRPSVLDTGDEAIIGDWRKLTTSDHVYYMATKFFGDGDVHTYFNPFPTPYDAFIAFMNVLEDLKRRIAGKGRRHT